MANPIPCAIDATHGDSDWMLTARTDIAHLPAGTTMGLCDQCLIGFSLARLQAEQEAEAQVQPVAPEPEPDQDFEPVVPKSKPQRAKTNGATVAEVEAEAAHD